jgi:hypothetical protein
MHLFDTADPRVIASEFPFYITFVLVALATYFLSAIGFAFVHDTNLKDAFGLLKREGERQRSREDSGGKARVEDEQQAEDSARAQSRADGAAEEKGRHWFFSRRMQRSHPTTEGV